MKFFYKFQNLLGTVYKKGNLLFTPDGNSVISPVGNRISIFDLKSHKTTTLPVESRFDYNALDVSPNGCTLIAINEEGHAQIISLISQTVIYRHHFKRKIQAVKFSPDGKHFAICKEGNVFVYMAPGPFSGVYNSFIMERVFHKASAETTCLDWSSDSKILAVGSKDMDVKLYPLNKCENFRIYTLGNHTDSIVGCFFEENSYDVTTISRNGQACIWKCTVQLGDLVPLSEAPKKKKKIEEDEEDDIDTRNVVEKTDEEIEKEAWKEKEGIERNEDKSNTKLFYKRVARHYLADEVRKDDREAVLTSAAYHKRTKILVVGFSNGTFFIYDVPDLNVIHSLAVSEQKITSITLNESGEWIALGCGGLGQLLVWEWQSETYAMKQQGHSNNMSCVAYSVDGELLVTGGEDGKVKLWNVHSGFCFVTFNEHSNAITAVAFSGTKKFVISASLDGTLRAFDVTRYRNFKTFTSPSLVQFVSCAVDVGGEFVAAGGQDVFEVYLWSVKTGKLLEILNGHEGPVVSLAFNPNAINTTLATVSWDKTLRIWDAIEKGSAHETIELPSDGLCVAFRPNGQEVAVATLDGQITTFNVRTAAQVASIEGRNDLGSGRSDTDLITAKKTLQAKAFTSICYSADGESILAGGQSKFVCIYNVSESMIVKKFEITQNRSLDAVDDFINRRKMTEFGNMALIEERDEREGGKVAIRLPGVRKGDMASRVFKPEVRVFSVQFSPTGQQWVAATTEGLLVYSLSSSLVFDPWDLQIGITPKKVREAIEDEDFLNALTMALKLNVPNIIEEVMENVPVKDVKLIVTDLSIQHIERLLIVISNALDNSRHLDFYLIWTQNILTLHGPKISANKNKNLPSLLVMMKSLSQRPDKILKYCNYIIYTLEFILGLPQKNEGAMEVDYKSDEDSDGVDINSDNDVKEITYL